MDMSNSLSTLARMSKCLFLMTLLFFFHFTDTDISFYESIFQMQSTMVKLHQL